MVELADTLVLGTSASRRASSSLAFPTMKCYITKRRNGLYLVTAMKPIITEVKGTGHNDAYLRPGDPVGFNNVTPEFGQHIFPLLNDILECKKGNLTGHTTIDKSTHVLTWNKYALGTIYCNFSGDKIDHVCPWFIEHMFGDVLTHNYVNLYMKGEYYG